MLSRANSRACSHGSSLVAAATVRAIRFHCSGELSTQNRAISVCSGVRALGVVTPSPPRALTSLRSAAYFRLGHRVGRTGTELRAVPEHERRDRLPSPGANANGRSGVKRYSPGSVPCGYAGSSSGVSEPSVGAQAEDRRGGGPSQLDPPRLGPAVGDGCERRRVVGLDARDARVDARLREGSGKLAE